MCPHRDASLFSSSAAFVEIFLSFSFFFSHSSRVPPFSLPSLTRQWWQFNFDATASTFSARIRGTLDNFFFSSLVFRPFSSTIARFRETMTRFYTSVRALRQRRYMCACVFYSVHVLVCTCYASLCNHVMRGFLSIKCQFSLWRTSD